MFTIYALKSEKDGRIYVGFSQGIKRRIREHNIGKVFSTKGYKPWRLVYTEAVGTRFEARKREKYLKSGVGKEFLKSNIPL